MPDTLMSDQYIISKSERTPSGTFDPKSWLERAERLGYRIFLWDAFGDKSLGLCICNPIPNGRGPSDLDLWWTLRPNEEQSDINEEALAFHLWDTGKIGPEEMRPDYAAVYTRADVWRPSARHLEALRKTACKSKRRVAALRA